LRRSELVGLRCADIEDHDDGLVVIVRASKTDQEGQGHRVPVAKGRDRFTCPVRALRAWLAVACPEGCDGSQPIFRRVDRWGSVGSSALTGRAVAMIVKRAAEAAGLDPERYAGHSLRAGFATTAAANGATERQIANVTRHRSMDVLRGYIREANLFADSAADKAGL
jgi:integrase